jgi:hypothetical protein
MVTTAELNRRGLRYAVVVDGAATPASLQALDRQGLPYLVEVADGATMASRAALEARGLRYFVPVAVGATSASKASLERQGLAYAVKVDADILPADRRELERQGLRYYVAVDSSGNSVGTAVGGGILLAGEANGFATDFLHPVDAERVAVKSSGSTLAYAVDAFYTQSGTSPKMVYDVAGTLGWSPHNLLTGSTDLSTGWSVGVGATKTLNQGTAPNGLNELVKYTMVAGAGAHWAFTTSATSATKANSVYAKAGTLNWLCISNSSPSGDGVYFNLATGVVGTKNGTSTGYMENSGGGIWRCVAVIPATTFVTLSFHSSDNESPVWTAAGGETIFVWGPQSNLGSVATSYLPTTTAARVGLALDYDPVTHAAKGLLCEPQATNSCLWNRDLTNAAWTKSNVTAAKDQTGVDGVANAASKITATAANGTCLQAITLASSARYQTAFVQRITGSGVINMTMDNGTTWTAITVTSSWQRLEIPTQTLANPTVGFRIVTSGDAVAVDLVQNEG